MPTGVYPRNPDQAAEDFEAMFEAALSTPAAEPAIEVPTEEELHDQRTLAETTAGLLIAAKIFDVDVYIDPYGNEISEAFREHREQELILLKKLMGEQGQLGT